jgi:NNP family nitrate/nitrite transporter-like MFS transporter
MLAIFLFAGIGNASTFKQMPMIFERRQAGGVIGWTAAIAAFGPFFFGVGVTTLGPDDVLLRSASPGPSCAWSITWVALRTPGRPKARLIDPPQPRDECGSGCPGHHFRTHG